MSNDIQRQDATPLFSVDVECFWCDPLSEADVELRRFSSIFKGRRDHDATVHIGVYPLPLDDYGHRAGSKMPDGSEVCATDLRWPAKCEKHHGCGYRFDGEDMSLVYITRRYRRADTGEVFSIRNKMPVGAMSWLPYVQCECGKDVSDPSDGDGDGRCVFVVIPCRPFVLASGGVLRTTRWKIDGLTAGEDIRRATGQIGRTWKRTGSVPKITVENGIRCPLGFAGTIVNGRLRGRMMADPEQLARRSA